MNKYSHGAIIAIVCVIAVSIWSHPSHAQGPDEWQASERSNDLYSDETASLPPRLGMKSIGTLSPSFYWIAVEKKDGEARDQKLLDMDGNVLYMTSKKFLKELKMEGTGKLLNGKLINYKGRVVLPNGAKEIRWRWCGPEAPFGYGYDDIPLNAFRSAAVDPTVVPLNSKLYIPAAKGIRLPDGTIHDGFFTAVDIGDMIQNRRIDIFTSFGDQSGVFQHNGFKHGSPVEIFLVQ